MDGTKERKDDRRSGGSLRAILRLRDFRLFWSGGTISMVGDQFYFIALAWLVVLLTDNVIVLGTILALGAVPRALFMMVGGAYTDRFSPRLIMVMSNALQFILVGIMTLLVLTQTIRIWMLYLFALSFGLSDAFSYPAHLAIIPRLVKKAHLRAANSMVQGMASLSFLVGPVMAGLVIGRLSGPASGFAGVGYAFAIDAATFLVAMITLMAMRERKLREKNDKDSRVISSIKNAFVYVRSDPALTSVLLLIIMGNFFLLGPLMVGIPIIAESRLAEGAVAYGIVMTSYGGGTLLGVIFAGAIPRPKAGRMGPLIAFVLGSSAAGLISLAFVNITWMAALASLTIGAALGFISVMLLTWIQSRIREDMMGRVMSLFMFGSVGIAPVSMMATGAVMEFNEMIMFVAAGMAMLGLCAAIILSPNTRNMGFENPKEERAEEAIAQPL